MHSQYRDLESKYKRVLSDLGNASKNLKIMADRINDQDIKLTELRTIKAEQESKM